MRAVLIFLGLSTVLACATGTPATDLPAAHKDGGITPKNDGGSTHDSGTTQPQPSDDGGSQTTTCTGGTVDCSGTCVDETSDPNNCGGCGIACQSTETCVSGTCTGGGSTNTSNAPPQGTCSHSLCTSGNYLDEGCDTEGCTIIICDPSYLADDFCCTTSWDSTCMQEVTDYCSPYSCN